ncbi:hypothetical protein GF343_03105 [Candidatus Woesearchaeota archaeon]|nr:hypothetical protein [Candidatus Woesearchaeota archaeon]
MNEKLENGAVLMLINKNKLTSSYDERKKLRKYLDITTPKGEINARRI